MAISFIIIILPALVLADMSIYLHGELKESKKYPNMELDMSKTHVFGYNRSIITDTERNTFNLSDDNLKNAVKSLFGKRPDYVYLHGPTPGARLDDLYHVFRWSPVTRTIRLLRYNILKVSSEPAVIHNEILKNDYVTPTTFDVKLSMEVQNRISSFWSTGVELSVEKNISYGIKVDFVDFNSEVSFYYNSPWGKNYQLSQDTTLRVNRSIVLEPGQSAISEIIVTKRTIQFELEYEIRLLGDVLVSYVKAYNKRVRNSFDIKECMDKLGVSNIVPFREVIEFEFYADTRINIYDQQNGTVLMQAVDWIKKI